ncbi:MAG: RHS repeat-associated core domain-containing protein [Balneolaceae bacterium]
MKTPALFLLSGMFLFLAHTAAMACSLNPTAKIVTDPEGTVFYHSDPVVFDGTTSTANCGSIDQYRWQIDDVTVSWSSAWSHTFNLASGESERVFKVQLRVRNSAGKYGYKTIYVPVTRNNKSLYYLTDHLGSVRVTVNEQGDPVGWDDYYPFGLQMPGRTQNASNPNDDVKFTGYELEQQGDLNIYHAGARMYDPVIGRFTSQDRFKEKYPSMSPYQYAALNPILFIDVNGDSVWVVTNEETMTHTVHFQGKVFNNSNVNISANQLEELKEAVASGLLESFSGDLSDGFSLEMSVELDVVSGMDQINDSDHVIAITNLDIQSQLAGDFVPGMVNEIGGKVIYLNQRSFEGNNIDFNGIVRTAIHEGGHTLGLEHTRGIFNLFNLMRASGSGRNINNSQRNTIIRNRDSLNRGTNRFGRILLPPPTQ